MDSCGILPSLSPCPSGVTVNRQEGLAALAEQVR